MRIEGETGTPLSAVRLGNLGEQIAKLERSAGSGASAEIFAIVRNSYSPEATVGGAYIELLRKLLEPLGVAVLDASHPAVRTAAHPLLGRALVK
jgi:uncharacterized protein YllA (UPF0747 family)